jgi:hypothetical protein
VRSQGGHLNSHLDPQRKLTEGSQGGLLLGTGGGSALVIKLLLQPNFKAVRYVAARARGLIAIELRAAAVAGEGMGRQLVSACGLEMESPEPRAWRRQCQ